VDALELANTVIVRRGRPVDALDPELGLHPLRAAVRGLFAAATAATAPPAGAVELVNRLARAPALQWSPDGPRLTPETASAGVARSAIELVAGGRLRACGNPRCVQYHLGDGGRAYCSAACANRARVARHAARTTDA
jgi:predicted RNA-binding Zn ribbon-like protein